jgi:hypothetical protein
VPQKDEEVFLAQTPFDTVKLDDGHCDELVDPDDPDIIGYKRKSHTDQKDDQKYEQDLMLRLVGAKDHEERTQIETEGRITYNKTCAFSFCVLPHLCTDAPQLFNGGRCT